jgi:hypothetical protein
MQTGCLQRQKYILSQFWRQKSELKVMDKIASFWRLWDIVPFF